MIAMALVCRPALLIADEPTTALDVTIQAQILKLIKRPAGANCGMAVLMITHDLGVVANVADEVVVHVSRRGDGERHARRISSSDPQHPYLKALMRAVPRFDMEPGERLMPIREIEARRPGTCSPQGRWPRRRRRRRAAADGRATSASASPSARAACSAAAARSESLRGRRCQLRRRARRMPGPGR